MSERTVEEVSLGLLTGVESLHFFSARLPSRMTIRKFVENEEDKKNIIIALRDSILTSLGLIIVISALMRSLKVFIISMILLLLTVWFYLGDLNMSIPQFLQEVIKR
jgi:hypothetical protein